MDARGVGKNFVFWPVKKSPAQTPYRRTFVSIRHGGPRPRRCADGGIRGVINNFSGGRNLLITVTVYWISTRLVVWKSVDDTHSHFSVTRIRQRASHGLCRIVEPIATMRVQNYAGGRITVAVAENAPQADTGICVRYLCNRRTTFQLIQSVARVSWR